MEDADWKASFTADVAKEVRRVRLERGLSVQKVADLCTEFGVPMKRSVLANFEGGRRPTLSIAELVTLALILQVPPVQLLFPVGRRDRTVLPPGSGDMDNTADTWTALKWFTGERDAQPPSVYVNGTISQDVADVSIFRDHDRMQAALEQAMRAFVSLIPMLPNGTAIESPEPGVTATPDQAVVAQYLSNRDRAEADLMAVRAEIRRRGMTPPDLPGEIAYVDKP